ncbi:hypothetical protein CBL_05863 [Carabus blaptoides fortunei]
MLNTRMIPTLDQTDGSGIVAHRGHVISLNIVALNGIHDWTHRCHASDDRRWPLAHIYNIFNLHTYNWHLNSNRREVLQVSYIQQSSNQAVFSSECSAYRMYDLIISNASNYSHGGIAVQGAEQAIACTIGTAGAVLGSILIWHLHKYAVMVKYDRGRHGCAVVNGGCRHQVGERWPTSPESCTSTVTQRHGIPMY